MTQPKLTAEEMAAAEIAAYEEKHYGTIAPGYPGPDKYAEQRAIAAIIHKHKTPAEKAADKMLEALETLFDLSESYIFPSDRTLSDVGALIAEAKEKENEAPNEKS